VTSLFTLKDVGYKNILEIDDLTIPGLQTTCIVGESGSGKTTLLKLLNHLLTCDRGELFFKGENIKNLNPVELRRELIMLPQTPLIFPGTVKDNLLIGLQFAEKPLVNDSVLEDILTKMRLNKDLAQSAAVLSGGEKQRLAIGRIILMEPDVFLLDEPTSALDDGTEEITMDMLTSFAGKRHKTIIMVTHSQEIAHKYGDTVITLQNGKVFKVEERKNNGEYCGN
jgi:putative ABC transport system ATP-binding protein